MKKELLKGLTEEQIAKVKACKNHEELLVLAKAEGIELTDEQLAAISGGGACSVASDVGDFLNPFDCPNAKVVDLDGESKRLYEKRFIKRVKRRTNR